MLQIIFKFFALILVSLKETFIKFNYRTLTIMQIIGILLQIIIIFAIFWTIAYWSYKACYIFEWRYKNITVPMYFRIYYEGGWLNKLEKIVMDPNFFTSNIIAFRLTQDWTLALAFITASYPVFYTFK